MNIQGIFNTKFAGIEYSTLTLWVLPNFVPMGSTTLCHSQPSSRMTVFLHLKIFFILFLIFQNPFYFVVVVVVILSQMVWLQSPHF